MGRAPIGLAVFVAWVTATCATYKAQSPEEADLETMTNALGTLRDRAAFELTCPRATIDVSEAEPGSSRYTAAGCGKSTTLQAQCERGSEGQRCVVWDTAVSAAPPDRHAPPSLVIPLSKSAIGAARAEAEREFECSDVVVIQVEVDARDTPRDTMWKPERDAREGGIVGASGCAKRTYYRVDCEFVPGGCTVQPTPAPR